MLNHNASTTDVEGVEGDSGSGTAKPCSLLVREMTY